MMKCILTRHHPALSLCLSSHAIQVPRHPVLLCQSCAGFGRQDVNEFGVPLFAAATDHLVYLVVAVSLGKRQGLVGLQIERLQDN